MQYIGFTILVSVIVFIVVCSRLSRTKRWAWEITCAMAPSVRTETHAAASVAEYRDALNRIAVLSDGHDELTEVGQLARDALSGVHHQQYLPPAARGR